MIHDKTSVTFIKQYGYQQDFQISQLADGTFISTTGPMYVDNVCFYQQQ